LNGLPVASTEPPERSSGVPGVDHVGQRLVRAREGFGLRDRHQVLAKARVARLEPVGGDVRHVVGDDVELTAERGLTRQADEKRVLHEPLPFLIPTGPSTLPSAGLAP
jgi:hypothetical protein